MCGIAGYIGINKIPKKYIDLGLKSLVQRGPDNQNKIEIKKKNLNIKLINNKILETGIPMNFERISENL